MAKVDDFTPKSLQVVQVQSVCVLVCVCMYVCVRVYVCDEYGVQDTYITIHMYAS